MNRIMLVVLACISVAACSDSLAPKAPDVRGQWLYRIQALSDGGKVSCAMSIEDTLFLGASASQVAGTYSGGTVTCTGADAESIDLVAGAVVNGTLDPMVNGGRTVAFDLGGAAWHQAGVLIGDRMSGTLTVDHVFVGKLGHVSLTGTWTAQRKSTSVKPPPK